MPTSPLCIVTVSNVAVTWIQLPAPAQLTITLYIYWDRERSGGAAEHSWTHHWYNGIMPQNLDIYTETRKLPHLAHPSAGDAWDAVPCPDAAVLQCCSDTIILLLAARRDSRAPTATHINGYTCPHWGLSSVRSSGLINGHIVWLPRPGPAHDTRSSQATANHTIRRGSQSCSKRENEK